MDTHSDNAASGEANEPAHGASLGMMAMLLPLALMAIVVSGLDRLESRSGIQPLPVDYRVDINAAGRDHLSLLPGVGPGVAENIIEYRDRAGPFTSADDLERVHLIGPLTRGRIEPWADFGSDASGRPGTGR